MAKFFLRTTKKNGTANLYTMVERPKLGIKWQVCTGIDVDIDAWNKAQKSTKALSNFYATESGKEVQTMMENVNVVIKDFFDTNRPTNYDKASLERNISEIVGAKTIKAKMEAKELARKIADDERKQNEQRLRSIITYYDEFLRRIESGELRQGRKNAPYRAASISGWKSFGKHLKGYLTKRNVLNMTFDEINKSFADGFTEYLQGKGYMLGTINQQVNCFRRLCNSAAEDERNTNAVSLRVWHSHEEKDDDKRAEIALSESEIDALYDMRLDGQREQVRDLWCLGYFCYQRVSDYSRLTSANFKQTSSGLPVIVLRQQKTGKDMVIPILDDRVFELCRKYDYHFPKLNREILNRVIKEVSKVLSESVPSLREYTQTVLSRKEREKEESFIDMKKRKERGEKLKGEEAKRYRRMKAYAQEHESGEMLYKRDDAGQAIKQRWELVTCHTSRRSAVTAMYDTGLYDLKDIMSVSGHQTLRNMEKYLRRDSIKQAEKIAEKARQAKTIKLRKEA